MLWSSRAAPTGKDDPAQSVHGAEIEELLACGIAGSSP